MDVARFNLASPYIQAVKISRIKKSSTDFDAIQIQKSLVYMEV